MWRRSPFFRKTRGTKEVGLSRLLQDKERPVRMFLRVLEIPGARILYN